MQLRMAKQPIMEPALRLIKVAFQHCYTCFRCEHTLTNSVTEACALTTAARSFAVANESLSQLHLPQFAENLHAAVNCFSHAIRVSANLHQTAILFICLHNIGQNIKSLDMSALRCLVSDVWSPMSGLRCPVSGICGQDCDIIHEPVFTRCGTQLLHIMH